jgi:hypothetical protein
MRAGKCLQSERYIHVQSGTSIEACPCQRRCFQSGPIVADIKLDKRFLLEAEAVVAQQLAAGPDSVGRPTEQFQPH